MSVEAKGKAKEDMAHRKTPSTSDTDWAPLQDSNLPRPFDIICKDLAALGALSIEDFLNNVPSSSSSAVNFDVNFHLQLPELLAPISPERDRASGTSGKVDDTDDVKNGKILRNALALLRQTCQSVFGSSEALNYEYLEEDPKNRQCILTITRPGGSTRSYRSESGPLRRGDAKAQAAQVAIEMGALDFIVSGDSDALKAKKGLLLNPLEVDPDSLELDVSSGSPAKPLTSEVKKEAEDDISINEIEQCCIEWRAGMVRPHWVFFNGFKDKKKHGAALRIALNAHVFRAYSVDPVYSNAKAAKIACAAVALKEGVLDFIKYGNGQTEPIKLEDDGQEYGMTILEPAPLPIETKGLTLQEYYETLPRPFPEDVGDVPASEINAPAWLNITLQSARGARLASHFMPIVDSTHHLHGHILRIERPDETRTYLVDPQFPKRIDAKSAVCLLAMSQGIGDYIRGLKDEAENKISPERRKLANQKILQVLAVECSKIRPGNRLHFNFITERDAFGCILKVDISSNASEPDIREYTAKTEYRNKADAKTAVACIAAEQGLIDLLRFRGATPPPDYVPFWEAQVNGDGDNYVPKRKELDREVLGEDQDRKKRRKGNSDNLSPRSVSKFKLPEDDSLPVRPASLLPKPMMTGPSNNNNNRWKKPHATGPRGLGPSSNAYASVPRSGGQDRSGNRGGGAHHPTPQPPSAPHRHSHGNRYPATMSPTSYSGPHHRNDHTHAHAHAPPPPLQPIYSYDYDDRSRADYRQGPSYPPAPAYPSSDPYGNAYPQYPAAAPPPPVEYQGHYSNLPYHSPSTLPPTPVSHQYLTHYDYAPPPPPPAPPTPPHTAYGHYSYSVQYPPHPPPPPAYPPSVYPVSYSSYPPVVYTPPAPAPLPAPLVPQSPPHYGSYSPRHRSSYDSHSPPPGHHRSIPPRSPPRSHPVHAHSHHHSYHSSYPSPTAAAHDDYVPSEPRWQRNSNYRRHSTTGDSSRGRSTSNNHRARPPPPVNDRNRHEARPPSSTPPPPPPIDIQTRFDHTHSSSNISVQPPPPPNDLERPQANPGDSAEKVDPSVTAPVSVPFAPKIEQVSSQSTESQLSQQQSPSKSHLDVLYDFCDKEGISRPTFYHRFIEEKDGKKAYKVWAEKDAQRLELQNHFSSVEEGYEKLSRRVLQWERSRLAKK